MGFDLWRLFMGFEKCFWVELNGCGGFSLDFWRLFAGVVLMQTMFNFCSYRNLKEEKNKEDAILILNLCFFFICFQR
jgi:hypothetical protein